MKPYKLLSLVVIISFYLLGCKKDSPADDCQELKNSLLIGNIDNVRSIITDHINTLNSQEYNEENINSLASALSNQCSISAKISCFDCIMTLPSETEIQLKFMNNQSTISKTIDISYTPENKMKFVGVHE